MKEWCVKELSVKEWCVKELYVKELCDKLCVCVKVLRVKCDGPGRKNNGDVARASMRFENARPSPVS